MIQKSRFGIVRALAAAARQSKIDLDKQDKRLSYIVDTHHFFMWNCEEDFDAFILNSLARLKRAHTKRRS